MPKTCVYLKSEFEPSTKEHILQAALGARWKSADFCSPETNSFFSKIDAELAKTVDPVRILLGAEGAYGAAPDLRHIPDRDGRSYNVASGGEFSLSRPYVQITPINEESAQVRAEINDDQQIDWAAAEILKQLSVLAPNLNISHSQLAKGIRAQAVLEKAKMESPLHFQLKIGGVEALRAITKSVFNLLAVNAPQVAIGDAFDAVRNFILLGKGEMEDFIRWGTRTPDNSPKIGDVDHFLAVWSDGCGVWGFCQLYGLLMHPIRLSSVPVAESFSFSYLVDPLREANPAESRNAPFEPLDLEGFNDALLRPEQPVQEGIVSRQKRLLALCMERMILSEVSSIIRDVLGSHEVAPTTEMAHDLSVRLTAFLDTLLPR